ncbi:MAG TPA: ABC transporter permease [Vicinamibacterales bacterium]|nr:ABC transporter permease [Vicinamibacterales bacterium]
MRRRLAAGAPWRRRVAGLIRKEFAQIGRDRPLVIILLWAFTAAIYSAGRGGATEAMNVATAVYDLSQGSASREFVSHLQPPYFKIVAHLQRESEITTWLDRGKAAIVVIIPPDFQRRVDGTRQAQIQVLSDGALAMPATVAGAYIAAISATYSVTVLERRAGISGALVRGPALDERLRVTFNPNMLSSWFSALLELLNMCTMVSLLLTAANLVREKERGTIERLLVSPAKPCEIFLAKIIPTVVVVLALCALSFLLVLVPVFGLPIRGSLLLFFSVTALYVFAMTSMGIAIALVARNMAQGVLIMILILQPMIFLSGAWNPPEAMSPWLRGISLVSPLRYFLDFGFGVILKGNGASVLARDIAGIAILGSVLFGFSLLWFERSLKVRTRA